MVLHIYLPFSVSVINKGDTNSCPTFPAESLRVKNRRQRNTGDNLLQVCYRVRDVKDEVGEAFPQTTWKSFPVAGSGHHGGFQQSKRLLERQHSIVQAAQDVAMLFMMQTLEGAVRGNALFDHCS